MSRRIWATHTGGTVPRASASGRRITHARATTPRTRSASPSRHPRRANERGRCCRSRVRLRARLARPASPPRPRVSGSDREARRGHVRVRLRPRTSSRGRHAPPSAEAAVARTAPSPPPPSGSTPRRWDACSTRPSALSASALGGVITSRAERLWSKRHSTPLTITHADTLQPRAPRRLPALSRRLRRRRRPAQQTRVHHRHVAPPTEILAVEYQREVLRMRDGGHVTLDWPISVPEFEPPTSEASATTASSASDSSEDSEASAASRLDATIWSAAVGLVLRVLRRRPGAGADGVPGVIGVAGGGGADGRGSGGGGCDVDAAAPLAPPGPPRHRARAQETLVRQRR